MAIKIILADDHKIMREGLKNLLEDKPDMEVVGEAKNGRDAVQLAIKFLPDIAIMDIAMPDLNGIEATKQILNESPATRIIALSMHSDKQFVTGMFRAGASGYLLKDCALEELAEAIRAVHVKHTYLSKEITDVVLKELVHKLENEAENSKEEITDREREVLQLIAEGISTKDIAGKLYVSAKTIETHRQKIMQKLNIFTIPELTKYAIRMGLTSLDG